MKTTQLLRVRLFIASLASLLAFGGPLRTPQAFAVRGNNGDPSGETLQQKIEDELIAAGITLTGSTAAQHLSTATSVQLQNAIKAAASEFPGDAADLAAYVISNLPVPSTAASTYAMLSTFSGFASTAALQGMTQSEVPGLFTNTAARDIAIAATEALRPRLTVANGYDESTAAKSAGTPLANIVSSLIKAAPSPNTAAASIAGDVANDSNLALTSLQKGILAGAAIKALAVANQPLYAAGITSAVGSSYSTVADKSTFAINVLKNAPATVSVQNAIIGAAAQLNGPLDTGTNLTNSEAFSRALIQALSTYANPTAAAIGQLVKNNGANLQTYAHDIALNSGTGTGAYKPSDVVRAAIAGGAASVDFTKAVAIANDLAQLTANVDAVHASIYTSVVNAVASDPTTVTNVVNAVFAQFPGFAAQDNSGAYSKTMYAAAVAKAAIANPTSVANAVNAVENKLSPSFTSTQSNLETFTSKIILGLSTSPAAITAAVNTVASSLASKVSTPNYVTFAQNITVPASVTSANKGAVASAVVAVSPGDAVSITNAVSNNITSTSTLVQNTGRALVAGSVIQSLIDINALGSINSVIDKSSDLMSDQQSGSNPASGNAQGLLAGLLAKAVPTYAANIANELYIHNGYTAPADAGALVGYIAKYIPTDATNITNAVQQLLPTTNSADQVTYVLTTAALAPTPFQTIVKAAALKLQTNGATDAALETFAAQLVQGSTIVGAMTVKGSNYPDKIAGGVAQVVSTNNAPQVAAAVAGVLPSAAAKIAGAVAAAVPSEAADTAAATAMVTSVVSVKGLIAKAAAAAVPNSADVIAVQVSQQVVTGTASVTLTNKATIAGNVIAGIPTSTANIRNVVTATLPNTNLGDQETYTIKVTTLAGSVADVVTTRVAEMANLTNLTALESFTAVVSAGSVAAATKIALGAAQYGLNNSVISDAAAFAYDVAHAIPVTNASARQNVAAGVSLASPSSVTSIVSMVAGDITNTMKSGTNTVTNVPLTDTNRIGVVSAVAKALPYKSTEAIYSLLSNNLLLQTSDLPTLAKNVVLATSTQFNKSMVADDIGAITALVTLFARNSLPPSPAPADYTANDTLVINIIKAVVQLKPTAAFDIVGAVRAALGYAFANGKPDPATLHGAETQTLDQQIIAAISSIANVPNGAASSAISAYLSGADHFQNVSFTTGVLDVDLTAVHPG